MPKGALSAGVEGGEGPFLHKAFGRAGYALIEAKVETKNSPRASQCDSSAGVRSFGLFIARRSIFVGAVRSGLGLARKFATVVLDWLENLARAAGGASWTGSKIWHGLLVAFGLTRKFGTGCWWHLELTRKSWTDSRSSHGMLVLEREASEKRGASGKELDAECAGGGRRGSGGGGGVGG
jgi:hypothetical protein